MKRLLLIGIITLAGNHAIAKPLVLDAAYLQPGGVIMTYTGAGDLIDPYFPTKALLTAHDSGMNIRALAKGWISWLIARQETDGLFSRFCRDEELRGGYRACLVADADDSMMAMWVELLYRMAPASGLPAAWQKSARKAQFQLDALYDHESGVYFISQTLPVGLLMDNIEIHAALSRSAQEAKRIGATRQAAQFSAKAEKLKAGIVKTFWDADKKTFRASTQARNELVFYPDTVAQLMPLLHGFHFDGAAPQGDLYSAWMRDHHQEWTGLIGKEYPWGLVAVVATQQDDRETAGCWLQQAEASRRSGPWDVLDEAAFQSVEWQLEKKWPGETPSCKKAVL